MRITLWIVATIAIIAMAPPARADDAADHEALTALRTAVVEAIKKGDIEEQIKYVHPDIVVTWQNHEVCKGVDGLRDFMKRMGTDAFKHYTVEPTPDDATILYGGDVGISYGRTAGVYQILGKEMEFENRWTATLVKEDGKWLLASYHVSINPLDNPILDSATNMLFLAAAGALVLGLILGWLIGRRRKAAAA